MDENPKPNDIMMPRIGAEAERPRDACPNCKHAPPKTLGVDDFPPSATEGVLQALKDGATLYGCERCFHRWAVLRQRMVRGADGMTSLEPVPNTSQGPTQKKGNGRRYNRAVGAHNARLIRKNARITARAGFPVEALRESLAASGPGSHEERAEERAEERRKVRNARKAARR